MRRIIIVVSLFLFVQIGITAQQTIWISPYEIVPADGNTNLHISTYGGAAVITSRTTGDLQWVELGLNLSNNQILDSVIINYQLVNAASFISQSRISTSKLIQQTVLTDDGTDLLSTTPDTYKFFVGQPVNGLITISFRLNFASTDDQIYIGAIGIVVAQPSTAINEQSQNKLPNNFKLEQNYPNPFNPSTKIDYYVADQGNVKINIFNSNGELIKTILDEEQNAGEKSVVWNGRDNNGNIVSSGVYYYQIQVGNFTEAKKMIMLK